MMKQYIYSIGTLLAALGFATACSDQLATDIPAAASLAHTQTLTVTATVGLPQSAPDTRLTLTDKATETTAGKGITVKWADKDEQFSVLRLGKTTENSENNYNHEIFKQIAAPNEKGKATFSGLFNLNEIAADNNTCYAVYPAFEATTGGTPESITLNLEGQTGDLNTNNKNYMYTVGTFNAGTNTIEFPDFQHLTALLKLTVKFPTESTGVDSPDMEIIDLDTKAITRTLSNKKAKITLLAASGLMSEATVDITNTPTPKPTDDNKEEITIEDVQLSNEIAPTATIYIHLLPGTLNYLYVSTTVDDRITLGGIINSGEKKIEAGYMYEAEVEVDDVIFVKGTGANNEVTVTMIPGHNELKATTINDFNSIAISGNLYGKDMAELRTWAYADTEGSVTRADGEATRTLLDLSNANLRGGNEWYYNNTGNNDAPQYAADNAVSNYMFTKFKVKEIILPDNITTIGQEAFSNSYIEKITIPGGASFSGSGMFSYCLNLKKVVIKEGVTTIAGQMFNGCSSLDYIEFPSSLQTVSVMAFSGCTALTTIKSYMETPPTLNQYMPYFTDDIKNKCTLYVPTGTVETYQNNGWSRYFPNGYIVEMSE